MINNLKSRIEKLLEKQLSTMESLTNHGDTIPTSTLESFDKFHWILNELEYQEKELNKVKSKKKKK